MAQMVGEAALSSMFGVLFDWLASQDVLEFFRGSNFTPALKEFNISLLSANALMNDAEGKQIRDPNVKMWLVELKEVLYQADHVMDKTKTEALRLKLENGESGSKKRKFWNLSLFSSFDNTVKSEIEEIHRKLKYLLSQADFLGLQKVDQTISSYKSYAPLLKEDEVFGREADKKAILKLLLSDNAGGHRITVFPIVGMGGIGKTTLAQLVYNDSSVQERFDLKAWVTVSEVFDVFKITKIIFEGITKRKCETEELHQLQEDLKEALKGKKFLFVHDDVWNEQYELWYLLKSSFESGAPGSKIIVTTRSAVVAGRMGNVQAFNLQFISNDDCWQLFAKHVFGNIGSDVPSELLDIGKQIVSKCKGLPLAVISMAGLLRSTSEPEEWRGLLQSDIWEGNHNTKIIPALWLSYQFLPPILKRCFAYFSIFPKDYEFHQEDMQKIIWMWMAEGILQPREGKTLEQVGEEYWNALVSRSFFQQSYTRLYESGEFFFFQQTYLSMHDLIHDLAMFVSGEFCFVYSSRDELHKLRSKTRFLSLDQNFEDNMAYEDLSKAKNLCSLLALPLRIRFHERKPNLTPKVLQELFLGAGGCLRILSLSDSSLKELPETIGKLKHLRYLDVSGTLLKDIPSSICTLYNLQTLLLDSCRELTLLPTVISKLINLRHLSIRGRYLKEMPSQMCNLTSLQTLSDFILSENDGSRIKELGELRLLYGSLCISGLENVKDVNDVLEAELKNKKHLSELILRWDGETDDSSKQMEVLNALQPHVDLKKLEIIGYRVIILPNWVTNLSLECIKLYDCMKLNVGLLAGNLPSLKRIQISDCTEMAAVFPSSPHIDAAYPSLEYIKLDYCKKLNVGLPAGNLPSLKEIQISRCDEMVAVFPSSPHIDAAYPSLQNLYLSDCSRLEWFSVMGSPSTLEVLEIRGCNLLIANRMSWNLRRLSSLVKLGLHRYEDALDSFPEEGLLPTTLRRLIISTFKKLKALNGKSFQHLTSLQQLSLFSCHQLECLPAEGLPHTLSCLQIDDCPLLSPRCHRETGEDWPKIQHIPRIELTR